MKVSRSTAFTSLEWFAESQHAQIRDMILSERPTTEIADVAGCNTRANVPDRSKSSGRSSFLSRDTSPHKFQLKVGTIRYALLCATFLLRMAWLILCVISLCLSFASRSQQVEVVLFLVFSLVVAFVTNRIVIRWQAPRGSDFNLISLHSNVRGLHRLQYLQDWFEQLTTSLVLQSVRYTGNINPLKGYYNGLSINSVTISC
jgi:hypothetical protein